MTQLPLVSIFTDWPGWPRQKAAPIVGGLIILCRQLRLRQRRKKSTFRLIAVNTGAADADWIVGLFSHDNIIDICANCGGKAIRIEAAKETPVTASQPTKI